MLDIRDAKWFIYSKDSLPFYLYLYNLVTSKESSNPIFFLQKILFYFIRAQQWAIILYKYHDLGHLNRFKKYFFNAIECLCFLYSRKTERKFFDLHFGFIIHTYYVTWTSNQSCPFLWLTINKWTITSWTSGACTGF